jgi:hypothetical protein
MPRMRMTLAIATAAVLAAAGPVRGQPRSESRVEPLYTPSAFSYGFHGFGLGAATGLGAGYLFARAGGFHGDDWRALVYGAGIGALVGGGLGLGLGIADMGAGTPGRGYFVLRDAGYGLTFGAAAGAITGGLVGVSSGHAERILLGTAIGGLAGTGAGLVLGIIEGQRGWRRVGPGFSVSLAAAVTANRGVALLPALAGRF